MTRIRSVDLSPDRVVVVVVGGGGWCALGKRCDRVRTESQQGGGHPAPGRGHRPAHHLQRHPAPHLRGVPDPTQHVRPDGGGFSRAACSRVRPRQLPLS